MRVTVYYNYKEDTAASLAVARRLRSITLILSGKTWGKKRLREFTWTIIWWWLSRCLKPDQHRHRVFTYHSDGVCFCPVGLEDMVLSALVQEQVEGITPTAIALMAPRKMAVCCKDYEAAYILFCVFTWMESMFYLFKKNGFWKILSCTNRNESMMLKLALI